MTDSIKKKINLNSIILKIKIIICLYCNDEDIKKKWFDDFNIYSEFKKKANLSNNSSESIDNIKLLKLRIIVTNNISDKYKEIDWENKIINILIGIDDGNDILDIDNIDNIDDFDFNYEYCTNITKNIILNEKIKLYDKFTINFLDEIYTNLEKIII